MAALTTLSYHRYNPNAARTATTLPAIRAYATAENKKLGMTERFQAVIDNLLEDLVVGRVSTWQKWSIGGRSDVPGGSGNGYYNVNCSVPGSPTFALSTNVPHMALIFPYVRMHAKQIFSSHPVMRTVAFQNTNGKLVVHARRLAANPAASVTITGLTPGTTACATYQTLRLPRPTGLMSSCVRAGMAC